MLKLRQTSVRTGAARRLVAQLVILLASLSGVAVADGPIASGKTFDRAVAEAGEVAVSIFTASTRSGIEEWVTRLTTSTLRKKDFCIILPVKRR